MKPVIEINVFTRVKRLIESAKLLEQAMLVNSPCAGWIHPTFELRGVDRRIAAMSEPARTGNGYELLKWRVTSEIQGLRPAQNASSGAGKQVRYIAQQSRAGDVTVAVTEKNNIPIRSSYTGIAPTTRKPPGILHETDCRPRL